jgi:hypothetical protein
MTAISSRLLGARAARVDRQAAPLQTWQAGWRTLLAAGLRGTRLAGLAAGLLAGLAGPAQAIAVAGDTGVGNNSNSAPARRFVPSAPAAGADAPALDLINARIDAVDAEARAITVRGKPLPLHPTRLRVVGPGGQTLSGARVLRPGMQVRFALEPEPRAGRVAAAGAADPAGGADALPAARPIVLIYIDSQP